MRTIRHDRQRRKLDEDMRKRERERTKIMCKTVIWKRKREEMENKEEEDLVEIEKNIRSAIDRVLYKKKQQEGVREKSKLISDLFHRSR